MKTFKSTSGVEQLQNDPVRAPIYDTVKEPRRAGHHRSRCRSGWDEKHQEQLLNGRGLQEKGGQSTGEISYITRTLTVRSFSSIRCAASNS